MSTASDQALRAWLEKRVPQWRRIATLHHDLSRARAGNARDAMDLAEGYRSVARDLSMARRLVPASRTRKTLESLYADLHAMLHRPPHRVGSDLMRILRVDVPGFIRDLRLHIVAVVVLFLAVTAAAAWLIDSNPDLAGLLLDEDTISAAERGELWTDDIVSVMPPAIVSLGLLTNNIVVMFSAFCAGVFFGLGTFYIVGINGALLGGLFAFTARYDLGMRLFEFVVAHGLVELSVICVSGAAGAALGEALIRPGTRTRREAFQQVSGRAIRLLAVLALLLVGCGFIEGYISTDPGFSLVGRIVIGLAYFALMVAILNGSLFDGRLFRRLAARAPRPAAS
jgi:uncharacterized membrane protein SpoIIM required for sporulation